jgi:hypothetical protein
MDGRSFCIHILPDTVSHVLELNKEDKAPTASVLGLPIQWYTAHDSESESFSRAAEDPSLDVVDFQKPNDSLPSSVPMDFSNVPESQLTQTTLDYNQLMHDMEVYQKHHIDGIVASPTLNQCSQPDAEEEDDDNLELLQRVQDLVEESKAEFTLELALLMVHL